jgi:DNA modification methylase
MDTDGSGKIVTENLKIFCGDALEKLRELPDASVQCCVTSPPYFGLRDYGMPGQIGLETQPCEFVKSLVAVFKEVRRVLRADGTFWLNIGDSYANDGKWGGHTGGKHVKALHCSPIGRNKRYTGLKPKDLIGIPWRLAFALQDDGFYLRSEITWCKKAPMPESVTDRPTSATEKIFLLTKSQNYFFDADAIKEPSTYPINSSKDLEPLNRKTFPTRQRNGIRCRKNQNYPRRNSRNYWLIGPEPCREAHSAVFPTTIPRRAILAGSKIGDTILDPFAGSGTTGAVALELGRKAILIELNPEYVELIKQRTNITPGLALKN